MTRVAFDTDALIEQLRAQHTASTEEALAACPDEGFRASVLAQAALYPALENCLLTFLGLREARRPDGFIGTTFGCFAGTVLDNIMITADDRAAVLQAFYGALGAALRGEGRYGTRNIEIPTRPAGTA